MVGNNTDRDICLLVFHVFHASHLTYFITQRFDRINVKDGIYILNNNSQTFKTHTCIDILLNQFCIVIMAVIFKLGKYVVPYFHVTVTVTTYCTARLTASVLFASVIIDFGTWTTRTCSMLPEVIFFPKTEDSLRCNSNLFIPDIKCFVIILVDRWI